MSDINFDFFEPLEPPELSKSAEKKRRGRPAGRKNKTKKAKVPAHYRPTLVAPLAQDPPRENSPQVNSLTVAISIVQMLKAYDRKERDYILDSVRKVLE